MARWPGPVGQMSAHAVTPRPKDPFDLAVIRLWLPGPAEASVRQPLGLWTAPARVALAGRTQETLTKVAADLVNQPVVIVAKLADKTDSKQ